jgi:hypothetical protein
MKGNVAMNKRTFTSLLLASHFLIVSVTNADDLTIPNTFTAGTPARAAEVNGNFTAVEASVDDNAADIAVNMTAIDVNSDGVAANTSDIAANTASIGNFATPQWLANGQPIGSVVGRAGLLTFSDYYLDIERSENRVEKKVGLFYFVDLGCVGQPYAIGSDTNIAQGVVFQAPHESDPIRLYYFLQGSTPIENIIFLSQTNATTGCVDATTQPRSGAPVFPNDPAITGVAEEFFDLPLTMGHR